MGTPSTGRAGIGVRLRISDGASPPTYATVGNVLSVNGGGGSINMLDSTHLDSPDFYNEMAPGLKTSTPWTGTVQFDPEDPTLNSTTGLKKYFEDRSLETFQLDFTQLSLAFGLEVDAYVSEIGNIEITPTGLMQQSFTLTPKGAVREVTLSVTP